jgi:hypothetical protein
MGPAAGSAVARMGQGLDTGFRRYDEGGGWQAFDVAVVFDVVLAFDVVFDVSWHLTWLLTWLLIVPPVVCAEHHSLWRHEPAAVLPPGEAWMPKRFHTGHGWPV